MIGEVIARLTKDIQYTLDISRLFFAIYLKEAVHTLHTEASYGSSCVSFSLYFSYVFSSTLYLGTSYREFNTDIRLYGYPTIVLKQPLCLLKDQMQINFSYATCQQLIFKMSFADLHYGDVIMSVIASLITSLTIVYSSVYSGADQRKHQSSASLAFVRGIQRRPMNSLHKGPVTRKMFPFDDVIMNKNDRVPAMPARRHAKRAVRCLRVP